MKKNITLLFIAFIVCSLISSCEKDDETNISTMTGSYELYLDGNLCSSRTTTEVGMIETTISLASGEAITILYAGVPSGIGASTQSAGYASQGSVSITGKNLLLSDNSTELYMSVSATITHESATRFTFQGTCSTPGNTSVTHTFSGSLESAAYASI